MRTRLALSAALPLVAALAACSTSGGTAPAGTGSSPATTATSTPRSTVKGVTSHPTTSTNADVTHPRTTTAPHRPTVQDGLDTVRSYMKREIGMRDPRLSSFRWTGKDTASVDVRPWLASERVLGPTTTVSLQRLRTVWFVTGARTAGIQVDRASLAGRVPSPLRVSGRLADDAPWSVTVTQDRYGADVVLGGDLLVSEKAGARFSKDVSFRRPTVGTGSVVFTEDLAMGGGALRATVIRIAFAPRPAAPSCAPSALLPIMRGWFDDPAIEARIAKVEVLRCRNGFAHVIAVPRVNPPGHNQLDSLEVYMQYQNGQWRSLDFGTGIGCDSEPPDAALVQACKALGYTK